ncbi:alpha/beta hydrolase family protein [Streptomyces antarcticus]|uniref:alpha/beta hydrolase family protein n=1 Tax=Streptomyces antarcticus TaxID=2996458 RepID=UPI002F34F13D
MLPEYRNHGASEKTIDTAHVADRDARAGLAELKRLGAQRVLVGGASCGGTTAAIAGADSDLPVVGLFVVSSPAQCGGDGVAAVRKISSPSLFVVSPGDMNGAVEREVRSLHAASAGVGKEFVIHNGGHHGTDMIRRDGARGNQLQDRVLTFIESAYARSE